MYFEFLLAMRYLKAKRKQAFISIITLILIVGVMMGVMALIVVLSVMNGSGITSGAVLRGLETASAKSVIDIAPMIIQGSLSSLDNTKDGLPSIIIGSELAKQEGVMPGDVLNVISPQGRLTPLGRSPNSRNYVITALFNSGMYEYDRTMTFVSLKEAQDFLGMEDSVTGIEVKVT